jgi:hypothetical protein
MKQVTTRKLTRGADHVGRFKICQTNRTRVVVVVVVVVNYDSSISSSMLMLMLLLIRVVRTCRQGIINLNTSRNAVVVVVCNSMMYSFQVDSMGSTNQIPSDNEIIAGRDVGQEGNHRVKSQ